MSSFFLSIAGSAVFELGCKTTRAYGTLTLDPRSLRALNALPAVAPESSEPDTDAPPNEPLTFGTVRDEK